MSNLNPLFEEIIGRHFPGLNVSDEPDTDPEDIDPETDPETDPERDEFFAKSRYRSGCARRMGRQCELLTQVAIRQLYDNADMTRLIRECAA
jgi:hypothetical protein